MAIPDREEVEKIICETPFLYCTYPDFDVVNDEITEDEKDEYFLENE